MTLHETSHLLARHASLLNQHGPYSRQELRFIAEHEDNEEFVELAAVARVLKVEMCSDR